MRDNLLPLLQNIDMTGYYNLNAACSDTEIVVRMGADSASDLA